MSNHRASRVDSSVEAIVVAVVLVLPALLAFSGSSFAEEALPLAVGFALGYCLARLAITRGYPSWVRIAGGFLAALIIIALGSVLVSSFADFGWSGWVRPLLGMGESLGSFAYGFSIAFCAVILRRLVFSYFFSDTSEGARERGREVARGTLIIRGLLLILTMLALVAFLVLGVLVYVVGTFAG